MATSGTTTFTQTRNEIILAALQTIGVYGIGRTVSSEDLTLCEIALNMMVKAWATEGLHLWAKEEAVLFVVPGQPSYVLGSTAKGCKLSDLTTTQLSGAHVTASTVLTMDSTSGIIATDTIGIVLSDKTIHWTTVSAVGSTTSLTIASGLASAADDDALVYSYTTALEQPLRVLDCRIRSDIGTSQTDLIVSPSSYQDYFRIVNKNTTNSPNQYCLVPGISSSTMYLWPAPSDGSERICYTYERRLEDLNEASETFDFPPEWLEALKYQLAVRLCRPFGKAAALNDVLPLASAVFKKLLDWDSEICTLEVSPEIRDY